MKIIRLLFPGILVFVLAACAMNQSLHMPASKGDLATVKAEIQGGKGINSKDIAGQTALMYASESGQMEVVKYLVENGADINLLSAKEGLGTALIYATTSNRIIVMEYLLDHGADINAKTPLGKESALFWAAARGHVEAVELLLSRDADTKMKNTNGQTVLEVAKETNRVDIVRLLSVE